MQTPCQEALLPDPALCLTVLDCDACEVEEDSECWSEFTLLLSWPKAELLLRGFLLVRCSGEVFLMSPLRTVALTFK